MKKRIFLSVLTFCFVIICHAQLFWKISGNGLTHPSYLFGTHHLIDKSKIPNVDKIFTYADSVDAVVGEMDMSNMMSMQTKMMQAVVMKDTTMHELLSVKEYVRVDSAVKSVVGVGLDKLDNMKPNMISTIYEIKQFLKLTNSNKSPSTFDVEIQNEGKKLNKKIIGLETIDQQINYLFNSFSLKTQAEDLVQMIDSNETSLDEIHKLNNAYQSGNLEELNRLSESRDGMSAQEKKMLIYNRNNNWIQQLDTILPRTSCFIAVGCLHLTGKSGLIQQLRNQGFSVKPVHF